MEPWQAELASTGELYRVGGAVRDEIMGVPHRAEDVDYLVRGLTPRRLQRILGKWGRVLLVGKSFGVYKFRPEGSRVEYDIAFPRKELSTGPGHRDFHIQRDGSLPVEEDLRRRDFTINAIAQNVIDDSIIDPLDGRKDIDERVLRMIFPEAFTEDPLRILRGVRFAARFALEIEEGTLQAMGEASSLLDTLSGERVGDELNKLLTQCDRPSDGLERLREVGGLSVILPELDRCHGITQNEYHPDDVFWHTLKTVDQAPKDNLRVRWAALLHDLGKVDTKTTVSEEEGEERVVFYGHEAVSTDIARRVLKRLRYGRDFIDSCAALVANHMFLYRPEWTRATVRRFIRRVGEDNLSDLFALHEADMLSRGNREEVVRTRELRDRVETELASEQALKIEDLQIDGGDVMRELGLPEGKRVGEVLRELFERVLDEPELNTRERLIEILREGYQ